MDVHSLTDPIANVLSTVRIVISGWLLVIVACFGTSNGLRVASISIREASITFWSLFLLLMLVHALEVVVESAGGLLRSRRNLTYAILDIAALRALVVITAAGLSIEDVRRLLIC